MAFSTRRGRPRSQPEQLDPGTPELRLKHALGLTTEPIDLCLSRNLITPGQHWCGLHLRWLYTLRYGAPVITSRYTDTAHTPAMAEETEDWRAMREKEYHDAIALLKQHKRYECVMRLCVFNELPAFLSPPLRRRADAEKSLAEQLAYTHHKVTEGLDILVLHWRTQRLSRHHTS
jgi:hypothetical protein